MPPRRHPSSQTTVVPSRTGVKRTPVVNPIVGYDAFVAGLKARIAAARVSAARRVNAELIHLYWDIGQSIVEKQQSLAWGDSVVEQVAADLRYEFPDMKGLSTANIWRIRQFYRALSEASFLAQAARESAKEDRAILQQRVAEIAPSIPSGGSRKRKLSAPKPSDPILAQVVRELAADIPWGHHVLLLGRVKVAAEHLYYLRATAAFGWSRAVLLNQIKARAYERTLAEGKTHNFPATLPAALAEQAEEALKSRYSLEFLGIHREVKERDLESRLITEVQRFILELGYGFCFIGRQHRLALGEKEYFVDLLFYHRFLKALVAIDLKVGGFTPEHAGKMDFYLNLLNERERAPEDRPSIGIILCAEKDGLEVEFALKTKTNPIGVAEYELQPSLPAEFRGKLPTPRQLTAALQLK